FTSGGDLPPYHSGEKKMNDVPVQIIVAAFNDPNRAAEIMDELKQGKKEGLIGIIDAAVVVKDGEGKLKVKDAKRRSTKGLITGGVVGGVIGLLAGPVGWLAVGGGAIGALAGKAAGSGLKSSMEEIGTALTPNSSAIVAVVEHKWVGILESMLAAEGARIAMDAIKDDIATQLNADGNVLYTAIDGPTASGVARVAESTGKTEVSGMIASDDGVFIGDAQFIDEAPADEESK
ncbi:MAG TPA: DUF1269 domain-containing protein, partial [Caldilinea sp.]|nr:DUF1269 domain-containing protein [Caldilinea sp.]